jgi:hypothetical protein
MWVLNADKRHGEVVPSERSFDNRCLHTVENLVKRDAIAGPPDEPAREPVISTPEVPNPEVLNPEP